MQPGAIISGIPANRQEFMALAAAEGLDPNLPMPVPSVADTMVQCSGCGRDCWIGPKQTLAHKLMGVPVNCYFCVIKMLRRDEVDLQIAALNSDRDELPRRNLKGPDRS